MDILKTKGQPFSTRFVDYYECKHCGVVDRDHERVEYEHPCSTCGTPGDGGRHHYPMPVHLLVDLMQEVYFLPSTDEAAAPPGYRSRETDHHLAIVIFFCTLNEVLLDHLLSNHMKFQGLPAGVRDRLLKDYRSISRRVANLFPSLIGRKWRDAVDDVSAAVGSECREVSAFAREAAKARNEFLHSGDQFRIPAEMPAECLRQIASLLKLYASLHNVYVRPLFTKSAGEGQEV